MMGAVAKTFGSLLIVIGLLLLLGGIAAAVYSFTDEQDNQDQLLRDSSRSDQNEDFLMYGLAGAGVGLVVLIVGVVLVSIGPKIVFATAPVTPATVAATGQPTPAARSRPIVVVAVVLGSVLGLLAVIWAIGSTSGDSANAFGTFGSSSDGSATLGEDVYEGTVAQGASSPVLGSITSGDNDHDLQAPRGTGRLSAVVEWTPEDGGAARLEVIVALEDGTELARQAGSPGFAIEFEGPELDGAQLHYQVFPADFVGAVVEQAFTIRTTFLAA